MKHLLILKAKIYLHWYRYVLPRLRWSRKDLLTKQPMITAKLTSEEEITIKKSWGKWFKKNKQWFEFYKTIWKSNNLAQFVPDSFYYAYVDDFFAKRSECKKIDDKNLYDLFFFDVQQPRTIVRKVNGVFLSPNYQLLDEKEAIQLCNKEGKVIVKKSTDSEGGKGIFFYNVTKDNDNIFIDTLKDGDFIIQEVIDQHQELSILHPQSINTVRIMTLYFQGEVHILSSVVRMGIGDALVDNASSGGIVCGVNEDGSLKDRAFDVIGNQYVVHPSSGIKFDSIIIPNYDKCKQLCLKLAPRLIGFTQLVSWDIAISREGRPILIEANLSYGEVDFHQMCNGPILGDLSDMVLKYVFENNPQLK